jgi:hypothetical protein
MIAKDVKEDGRHNASKNNVVKRILADGTYESKKNFQYLHDNGVSKQLLR